MSFDRLQKCIRAKKCPVAIPLGVEPRLLPQTEGDPAALAEAQLRYSLSLMDDLKALVPAVVLRVPYWEAAGWQGWKALAECACRAHEAGLFVIADARRCDAGAAAAAYGQAWLGLEGVDCLTVNAYQGSDGVSPLLELCRREDKCVAVVARTANPSAGEVQELMAGDRVVGTALGDLAQRLGQNDMGQTGYSRVGAMISSPWPSELRTLRKRLERTFLLLPVGEDGMCAPEDAWYVFDKYGRGALALLSLPEAEGDPVPAARAAVEALRDTIKQSVTLL